MPRKLKATVPPLANFSSGLCACSRLNLGIGKCFYIATSMEWTHGFFQDVNFRSLKSLNGGTVYAPLFADARQATA